MESLPFPSGLMEERVAGCANSCGKGGRGAGGDVGSSSGLGQRVGNFKAGCEIPGEEANKDCSNGKGSSSESQRAIFARGVQTCEYCWGA